MQSAASAKGRVERAIRYARDNFFAAREWTDLADLNAQALAWCQGPAAERPYPEDRSLTVQQAFVAEKPRLLPLPDNPFPAEERIEVQVGRTPYVRFDLNDYSVPPAFVRRTLVVIATLEQVRVLDGNEVVASHARSWSRGEQIEDPAHVRELVDLKRNAREHRGLDRLHSAVPATARLLLELAQRGANLGSVTSGLLRLLDSHGAAALEEAVLEALDKDVPHLAAIRHVLDRKRHERGQRPPIAVTLPDDPRVRDLTIRPHRLEDYEDLHKENDDDPDPNPEPEPEA